MKDSKDELWYPTTFTLDIILSKIEIVSNEKICETKDYNQLSRDTVLDSFLKFSVSENV